MSESIQIGEHVDKSFNDLYQQALKLGAYEGAELTELPKYVQMRLRPILEGICGGNTGEGEGIVLSVQLSNLQHSAVPSRETVVFQQDYDSPAEMCIEEYFYEEALRKIHVQARKRDTGGQVCCFQHLVPFFKERGRCEAVSSMATYEMIECTVLLN